MHRSRLIALALSSCLAWLATASQAALVVYNSQAAYLAAISAPGIDTYNDLNPVVPLGTPINRTAGTYSYTASAGPLSNFFPAGASPDVWLATNNRTDTVTFNGFSAGVVGVGGFFFRSDISGSLTTTAATLNLSATDADGTIVQALVNPGPSSFLGFVSTSGMTSLQVWVGTRGTGTAGVWPTINDLTLGAAVPAAVPTPGTAALVGAAMLGLGVVSVRRPARKS